MKLIVFLIWLSVVSVIPLSTTIVSFYIFRGSLKLISSIGVLFSFSLIVRDILFYMPQVSFFDRLIKYFSTQQLCVSFYVIYLPMAILFILYPILFYGFSKFINWNKE